MVAELDGFQGFQRWAGAAGEARMAEFGQALAQFGAAQLAAEQVACLAVGQQDLPCGSQIRVATGRPSRPSAMNRRLSRVRLTACSRAAMRFCNGSLPARGAGPLGQHLGLAVETRQFPAKVGEHRVQPAPAPDQVGQQQADQAGQRRPPPAVEQQRPGKTQGQDRAGQGEEQGVARAEQHQAEQQRYAGGGEQGGEPGLQVDGGALLQQPVEDVGLDLHPGVVPRLADSGVT